MNPSEEHATRSREADGPARRRAAPASLWFLPLAAVSYLIQTVPVVGVFTMLLMGAAWPMLFVAAALIGTAFEAATGRVHRAWLVLPLAAISSYEAFALRDHMRAWDASARTRKANEGRAITFDPNVTALVIRDSDQSRPAFEPEDLVARHRIPALYVKGNPTRDDHAYRSIRLATEAQCEGEGANRRGIVDPEHGLDPRGCILSIRETPGKPMLIVSTHRSWDMLGSMPIERVAYALRRSGFGSESIVVRQGTVRPLSWLPLFQAGCGLDSASPAWRCGWGFLRERMTLGEEDHAFPERTVARALSLKPMNREERVFPSDPDLVEAMARQKRRDVDEAFGLAEGIVSGPMRTVPAERLRPMLEDADRLTDAMPNLLIWVEGNITRPRLAPRDRICNEYVEPESLACDRRNRIANATTLASILSESNVKATEGMQERIRRIEGTVEAHANRPTGWEAKRIRDERRRERNEARAMRAASENQ